MRAGAEIPAGDREKFVDAREALLNDPELSEHEKRLLRGVSLTVHPRDDMYARGNERQYLRVGLAAMRSIDTAIESWQRRVGMRDVRSVLDMACGYGRVLRFIRPR